MVVFIIALLAGLSRPFLLQSTIAANENVALTTMRVILSGQIQHNVRSKSYGTLAQLVNTGLVEKTLQDGIKSGYDFSVSNISNANFELIAIPSAPGSTGNRGFFMDETAVIRFSSDGTAPDKSSPPI
jgi:hypothetical protein